jgi:hypothetical protein
MLGRAPSARRNVSFPRAKIGPGRRAVGGTALAEPPPVSLRRPRSRCLRLAAPRVPGLLVAALLAGAGVRAAAPQLPEVAWRSRSGLPGIRDAEALALEPASGRIALGDARGVWLLEGEAAPRRVLGRGPVRDLLFRPGGALLAATDRGLYRIEPEGRVRYLRLGRGRGSRARRLAASGPAVVVGTEDGLYASQGGESFERLDAVLPGGPVDAVALRPADDGLELWTSSQGALYRARLRPGPGPSAAVDGVEAPAIADGPGSREAVDLAVDRDGAEVIVLSPQHVALLRGGRWRSEALGLPAGARARRLGAGAGRVWIATDGGVVAAEGWGGPWRRAAPPAGSAATSALAGAGDRVLALGERGLLEGRLRLPGSAPEAAPLAGGLATDAYLWRLREEPSVQQVHAAALRWLSLGPERMRSLRRRVDRRGWLPDLAIRGGTSRGQSLRRLEDQAQSSGVVYDLFDRQRDRGTDYDVSVVLEWSLGDLVFDPDALDVSKEARDVIELRDEVLDEVTQLYFERRRTLLALTAATGDATERARLRLRADELAAGLDAWTGGFFSRHAPPLAAVAAPSSPLAPQGEPAP